MRIEALAARLFALRALVVFMAAFLLLGGLVSEAWAGGSDDAWRPLDHPVELRSAPREAGRDGRLDVRLDDAGDVAETISPVLSWRLEIAGNGLPYLEGYVFSIRPAAVPAEESPCGAGEICPAGYATPSMSREVKWEPIERAEGTPVVRTWVTVTLPLDLAWVGFLTELEAAAAAACRDGYRAARDAGRSAGELRRADFALKLTFPLKAAVFAGPYVAETQIPLTLACWGGGFSRDEILAAPLPPGSL
ncbi:MAG: hypothetical protein ACFCUW_12105 [Kiloniellaceae bacterium]